MCSSGDSISQIEQEEGSLEMVKWIGRLSLSVQRSRDAWMDNLPMSALSEEQRRIQNLADMPKKVLKYQQEVRRFWIRTHEKTEKNGILHK